MRTYWTAHALARQGHEVHVVTNAKEVVPPFRMHMRAQDWQRCEATYGNGSVTVHWTEPVDRQQAYIPSASPFVSKLAAVAARLHSERPLDVIYSFYLEPYGVAGHLAAQIAGVPHVARMAGSDAGRLWHHPQLQCLYDHVLKSADVVIAAGKVAERAVARGVPIERIAFDRGICVPNDLFSPSGPALDIAALRSEVMQNGELRHLIWGEFAGDRPYFGVYGKLGERKGSFALLAALAQLKRAGIDVGLVALAHGAAADQQAFRNRASRLKLRERILQLPFLPHWRVPEFLRGCLAICCLEQDFPIGFHMPIIPREVLLCGGCLVASTEVIGKLPKHARLPDRYACVAIEDVTDVAALAAKLASIATDPGPRAVIGVRGRAFACELQERVPFPHALENILSAAVARRPLAPSVRTGKAGSARAESRVFPLTALAATFIPEGAALAPAGSDASVAQAIDLPGAHAIFAGIKDAGVRPAGKHLLPLLLPVQVEIAIASVVEELVARQPESRNEGMRERLFRLHSKRWAVEYGDLLRLFPKRAPQVRVLAFDHDLAPFMHVHTADMLLQQAEAAMRDPSARPSYLVVHGRAAGELADPLLVHKATAEFLQRCDGTNSVAAIVQDIESDAPELNQENGRPWVEEMFLSELFSLHDQPIAPQAEDSRASNFVTVRSPFSLATEACP
jgi:glycosyltransferase involved in cell wall biosynthesis